MNILVGEDEAISRLLLETTLGRFGYKVKAVGDGQKAWEVLSQPNPPQLAILDWNMPEVDGLELCRRVRKGKEYVYVILLTGRGDREDILEGLRAGADDFIVKPFDPDQLQARLKTGERIVNLEQNLKKTIEELRSTLEHVQQLQGLLPICMYCKSIRDDAETWQKIESYIEQRSEARFTHAICEKCFEKRFPP
jgi:DNA-binding response OmpR family regulator